MALQKRIIQGLGVLPTIDPEEEVRKSIDLLRTYLARYPFLGTSILGIGGEQDSILAGRLAQLAMAEMHEETGDMSCQFVAIRLSHGKQTDKADTQAALAFIRPDVFLRVDIKPTTDAVVGPLESIGAQISSFNKGSMKARQHMITRYAAAGKNAGAVIGTDHAAEDVVAFFTKRGDGGANTLPLFCLNKHQEGTLLKELEVPKALYLEIPTVGLEDDRPLIADEAALGVMYGAVNDYLEGKEISETDQQTTENWYKKG